MCRKGLAFSVPTDVKRGGVFYTSTPRSVTATSAHNLSTIPVVMHGSALYVHRE